MHLDGLQSALLDDHRSNHYKRLKMKKLAQAFIAKDIKHYFGFLFDKGYKIRDIQYFRESFGNWRVVLESPICLIIISQDRNAIFVSFSSASAGMKKQIGIRAMIYFLSQKQNFIGDFNGNLFWGKKKQFERLAGLVKEYIDQITPFFGSDFKKYQAELLVAQKEYNNLLLRRYIDG